MPTLNNETKQLTRLGCRKAKTFSDKQTEPTNRGRLNDIQGAPLALFPSVGQCRSGVYTGPLRATHLMADLKVCHKMGFINQITTTISEIIKGKTYKKELENGNQ